MKKHPPFLFFKMRKNILPFIFAVVLLISHSLPARCSEIKIYTLKVCDSSTISINPIELKMIISATDSLTLKNSVNVDSPLKKKFISALFAFPFPFGFVGAHRVMLGTKPWVPVIYVATFGGCFGLLPLIDFFVIVFSKDIEQYENNPNIFMWVK